MSKQDLLKRMEVAVEETWDLSSLYANFSKWDEAFHSLPSDDELLKTISDKFKDKLSTSAQLIFQCFEYKDSLMRKLENLYVYANLRLSEDVIEKEANEYCAKINNKLSIFSAAFAFLEPELVQIPELEKWTEEVPLKIYAFRLKNILRYKEHLLSEKEEALLSKLAVPLATFGETHSKWSNADLKFHSVQDSAGQEHVVSQARFGVHMHSPDRVLRKNSFESYYCEIAKWRNTIASNYFGNMVTGSISAKARGFQGYLHQELFSDEIPVTLYDNLIDSVENNVSSLHDSMSFRKKKLGIDKVAPYDRYAPLFSSSKEIHFTWEQGRDLVLSAVECLGEEYVSIATKGLTSERWIDRSENEGKRSGAFSWGTYDSNPFLLQTWNGTLNDVYTLAHELGHSMHSFYSHKNQPYHDASYTIFVAEVASTLNEAILTDYLMEKQSDEEIKKAVVSKTLENFEATVLRQVLFATFERSVAKLTDNGGALTADHLDEIYLELNRKWYGEMSEYPLFISHEWMRIPHFYTPFYVYKYATSYCASAALFSKLKGKNGIENVFKMLKAGGSKSSLDILKESGVDMLSKDPVNFAFQNYELSLKYAKSL